MTDLEKSVLATIVWFDLFDRPLTLLELQSQPMEVESPYFELKNGLYFLKGRGELISVRKSRAKISETKFKKARRIALILSHVPFVRAIALCNSLGFSNAKDSSDIDFFIITGKGRIFTARFFSALLVALLGLRPNRVTSKDKICLSFFVTEEALALLPFAHPELKEWPYDVYLDYWKKGLVPLFNEQQVFEKFCKMNKTNARQSPKRLLDNSSWRYRIKHIHEAIFSAGLGNAFESALQRFQRKILPRKLKEKIGKGTDVIFSPSVLKFHENDRRKIFHDQFLAKFNSLTKSL